MTAPLLTQEQVEFYKTNGYLLYKKQLFSADKQSRLRSIFEDQLAQKGNKLSDELDTPHFRENMLLEFLLSDEVLDLVEPIIGPNILLWSSHFISKDPYKGRATPWHEDSAYWSGRVDRYDQIVTVWLAIDRSTEENGCLSVIPRTHDNGFSEYETVDIVKNTFGTQIKSVDETKTVYFELEPGECSLHDSRLVHGAKPNNSPHRRCGYTMRYISTETKVFTEKNVGHKLWLARGKDIAGNQYVNA